MKRLIDDVIHELEALRKNGKTAVVASIYTASDIRANIVHNGNEAVNNDENVLSLFERNYEDMEVEAYEHACKEVEYSIGE